MHEAQRDSAIVEYDTVAGRDRKSITKNAISWKWLEPATWDFEHAYRSTRPTFDTDRKSVRPRPLPVWRSERLQIRRWISSRPRDLETENSVWVYGFYVRFDSQGHVTSGSGVMGVKNWTPELGAHEFPICWRVYHTTDVVFVCKSWWRYRLTPLWSAIGVLRHLFLE